MQISHVTLSRINSPFRKHNNIAKPDYINKPSKTFAIDNFSVPFLGSLKYKYTPVSSKIPNYNTPVGNYENLDKFCDLYAQKINSQLLTIGKKDVENLIKRIKLKTNAPDDLVKEVLYQLTLFSNYNSIDFFVDLAQKYSTSCFGCNPLDSMNNADASLNSALNYLLNEKTISKGGCEPKRIVILDDTFLKEIQYAKENQDQNPSYHDFLRNIAIDSFIFVNIPGWDVKCLDNNYRSANFLLGSGFLEDIAIDTIRRINRGEKLEDILYGDFEKRLKDLTKIRDIKVEKISPDIKTGPKSTADIYSNLKNPRLTAYDVKKAVLNEMRYADVSDRRKLRLALCKLMDEFSHVYSNDSMSSDLVKLHERVQKKLKNSTRETMYCIANAIKSPSYITSIYAKLNNIDPKKIKVCSRYLYLKTGNDLSGKNVILLDDNSSTGDTIEDFEELFKKNRHDINTFWFVLLATQAAIYKLNDIRNCIPSGFNFLTQIRDMSNINYEESILTPEETTLISNNLYGGYGRSKTMCAFSHMIPDNCIDICSVLFKKLLYKSNYDTNKPLEKYQARIKLKKDDKNVSFTGKYRPVSSKKPDYKPINCDYSNIIEFSKLFSDKINSQLRTLEPSDIEALYNRIKLKTGADDKTITEVLYNITLFSNYDTIDYLQKITDEHKTNYFGIPMYFAKGQQDISSNVALNYFTKSKKFIKYYNSKHNKSLVVLDGLLIKEIQDSKNKNDRLYKKFIEDLQSGAIKLISLKGWDIECSDKKYRSGVFMYGTGQIEDLAIDIIKRLKRGEVLDDILYSNFDKKLKDVIGDDLEDYKIKIHKYEGNKKECISKKDIERNLRTPHLEHYTILIKIRSMLENFANKRNYTIKDDKDFEDFNENMRNYSAILAKYLDETTAAYSFDTINCELVKLYEKIKKQYGQDIIYLIMESRKSSSLISHLFAHTNFISYDRFFTFENSDLYLKELEKGNTTTFVLDDIAASGKTIDKYCRRTKFIRKRDIASFNFGLLTASDYAIKKFAECEYKKGSMLFMRKIRDLDDMKLLNQTELKTLNELINSGYLGNGISVFYPYIIPDNCSNLPASIFDNLLIASNENSNKAAIYCKTYQ